MKMAWAFMLILMFVSSSWAVTDSLPLPTDNELNFRNPFLDFLPEPKVVEEPETPQPAVTPRPEPARSERRVTRETATPQGAVPQEKPAVVAPEMEITGLVWNSERPQAIVNGEVVSIGDIVEGSEIIDINKTQIKVLHQGQEFTIQYN